MSSSSSSLVPAGDDGDDITESIERALANYAASKVSSLSKSDISLLSDDAIFKLIEAEYSRKSEDDIKRIMDAEFYRFLPIIQAVLGNIFSPPPPPPKKKTNEKPKPKHSILSIIAYPFIMMAFQPSFYAFIALSLFLALKLDTSYHFETSTCIVAQEERPNHSKRSNFVSKYSTAPDLKGLKVIGETYIQEKKTTLA